jgi:hypothetical protein
MKAIASAPDTTLGELVDFCSSEDFTAKRLTFLELESTRSTLLGEILPRVGTDQAASSRAPSLIYSASKEASSFLRAIPYDATGTFHTDLFKTSMEMFLGLPISAANNVSFCKYCNKAMDGGYHPLVCRKTKSAIYQSAHKGLQRDISLGIMQGCGSKVTPEPKLGITDMKRGDILAEPLGPKISQAYVEVTSKNTFSSLPSDWTKATTGFAAEQAVLLKHKKYDDLVKQQPRQPGCDHPSFFVFAVETTGAWAKQNFLLLDKVKEAACLKLPEHRIPSFIPTLGRTISLNHRKNIVQGLLDVISLVSPVPVSEPNMCYQDLDNITLVVEDL